jgi:ABC-type lipoprotein release transport system permease subunit
MSEIRDAALARRRFVMTLVITFAGAGLLLALVGVYGVMAQLARGRRRELGIRVALGAPLAGIQMLVVRKGLVLAVLGTSIGTLGSIAATRTMSGMLYGVAPSDPTTLVAVALLLTGAAVAATLPPAPRAARVDPIETLRFE